MRIGLLSDTHGYLDDRILSYLKDTDQIWHAGDIGSEKVLDQLEAIKPVRAVFGNIDSHNIRTRTKEVLFFEINRVKVGIIHIAGSPTKLNFETKNLILEKNIQLLVCGHSHVLKVMPLPFNKKTLYVNPGAAGIYGFHHVRTLLRFSLIDGNITDMQAVELGPRSTKSFNIAE